MFKYWVPLLNGINLGGHLKSIQSLVMAFVVFGLIGSINFGFPFFEKEEFSVHVNVRNDGDDDLRRLYGFDDNIQDDDEDEPGFVDHRNDDDLEDVRVRVFIPELGIMYTTAPFDLDDHNMPSKVLYGDANADLCDQWVKITVSNDEARRAKWRQIIC